MYFFTELKKVLDSFAFTTGRLNPYSSIGQNIVQNHLKRRTLDKATLISQLSLLVRKLFLVVDAFSRILNPLNFFFLLDLGFYHALIQMNGTRKMVSWADSGFEPGFSRT